MNKRDLGIMVAIYLVGLAITVYYAMTHNVVASDRITEYELYLRYIQTGTWSFTYDLVNSCPMATLVPAYIQRITHLDAYTLFAVYPCVFYALMPAFIYLIALKFMEWKYAILASAITLSNFYFLYYPNMGRFSVAMGFWATLIWAILEKRFVVALVSGVFLVFSYYTATIFSIAYIVAGIAIALFYKVDRNYVKRMAIVLGVIVVLFAGWHFGIANASGAASKNLVKSAIGEVQSPNTIISGEREQLAQVAFGGNLASMSIPQKIEFALSWYIVIGIGIGTLWYIWKRKVKSVYLGMVLCAVATIFVSVLIPQFSSAYGTGRPFLMGMIVLAPFYVIGTKKLTYPVQASLIGSYALCTSGIMYFFFGIVK